MKYKKQGMDTSKNTCSALVRGHDKLILCEMNKTKNTSKPTCFPRNPDTGLSLMDSLPVATMVKHKSWKARMDLSRDPRESSLIRFFRVVDQIIGCGLI